MRFLPFSPGAPTPAEQWRGSVDFIIRARGARVSGDRNFSAAERSSGFNFNCGASCYLRASFASSLSLFVSPFLCHLICPLKSARARARARIPGCRIFIGILPARAILRETAQRSLVPCPSPLFTPEDEDEDEGEGEGEAGILLALRYVRARGAISLRGGERSQINAVP